MKQFKYSDDLGFELKKRLLFEGSLPSYFDKREFNQTHLFREYSQRLEYDAVPEFRVIQILQANSDFERGKILFENLAHLSRREASDIGLWNYLSHNELYRVVHKMWPDIENPPNKSSRESYVLNHWIMTSSAQSELMDYPLSGLWWSFFLTIDEERADKYELTRIFFKNLTFRTKIFGQSKIARQKEALIGVLEFIKDNGLDQRNFEENGNAIVPYLNLLGGVKPLGVFDRTWFKLKLNRKFRNDIDCYGRLFRRTERPLLGEEPIPEAEEVLFQDDKLVICVWEDGVELTNSIRNGLSFQFEVDFSLPNHSLFIVLKNGFVKKIDKEILQALVFNQKRMFNAKLPASILNVFYDMSDCLLLACFKNNLNRKSLKIYCGDLINGSSINGLSKHVNSMTRELKIIPIPNSYLFKTPSLVKNYPEAALSLDDLLAKDEIEILKPIIQKYQMFN